MTETVVPQIVPVDIIPAPRHSVEDVTSQPLRSRDQQRLTILGVDVDVLTVNEALCKVGDLLSTREPSRLVFVNASCMNLTASNCEYEQVVKRSDLVLNDGVGLDIAARLQGQRFPANLNGTDFTPEVLRLAAARRLRVYLLGGQTGVAERAKANLEAMVPGLNVVGTSHGYASIRDNEDVVRRIRELNVDLLIVGMGAPTQEIWLDQHLASTGARLGMAVGAFLDFAAGVVTRAPRWVRRARMEWGYRLAREPFRLSKRYVMGNPIFITRITMAAARGSQSELTDRPSARAV